MENFQEATSRQVKLLTSRLNEALSSGLELLHSELGVDLGLKPELIPPWVVLLAACIGLVLLVALWASACRFLFKTRPAALDGGFVVKPDGPRPAVKPEDQKKKKKKAEKKAQEAQPNGRAVPEAQEDATVSGEVVPHHQSPPPQGKENASEVKKSKKKPKQVVKETKTASADGKEPEEGTWETKVSNKEKREQRKKEKTSSDGSASPGGGNASSGGPQELPKPAPAQAPAGQKKKKGESTKVKVEKVEAVASQVRSSEPASSSTKAAVKAAAHTAAQAPGRWAAKREPAALWGSEIDGSWTVIEGGVKTSDQNQGSSFSGLGVAEPRADLPCQPKVEDEWSGQNGGTVDASSDWSFPAEAWGNYEEPAPCPPAAPQVVPPELAKVHLLMEAADDEDDDKDKADAGDAAGKTKRRKKKKRKVAEEGQGSQDSEEPEKEVVHEAPVKKQQQQPAQEKAPAAQPAKAAAAEARAERAVKDSVSQKPPVTQVPQKPSEAEPIAKQNHLPAPAQQKKTEESQAPKPVKKKKARRET